MSGTQFVALLRGINVGGNNIIRMADLRTCMEQHGFADVATYIQSGNVLFSAAPSSAARLPAKVGEALAATFGYRGTVVIRSHEALRATVAQAPPGFGTRPDRYRYDCIFLAPALTAADALAQVPVRDGVDQAWAGPGVLYHARLAAKASQSRMNKIVGTPMYQHVTIRNWRTTTRLLALMDERDA